MSTIQKHNTTVKHWAQSTRKAVKDKLNQLNVKNTGALLRSVRYGVGKSFGYADKVRLQFEKHGIWVEKGVGRGWPIERVRDTTAIVPGGRTPKPWLNETLDQQVPVLADNIADVNADLILESIKIR